MGVYFRRWFRSISLVSALGCAVLCGPVVWGADCEPTSNNDIAQMLKQSQSKIFLVKFDDALARLREAEGRITCLTEPVSRESISQLYLFRGVASFNKGDEAAALKAFRQAVVIDRATRWIDRFGQRPRELFIEAKESALLTDKATVTIPELIPRVLVFVDGEASASGTRLKLAPGRHFLQVKSDSTMVFTGAFVVAEGEKSFAKVPQAYVTAAAAHTDVGPVAGQQTNAPKESRVPFDTRKLRPVSYVLFGMSGVGIATAIGAGLVTVSTETDLFDGYYSNGYSEERDALLERNDKAALLTNVGIGTSVLFGGVGAALFFLSSGDDAEGMSFVYPWVSGASMGIGWEGRF